MGIEARNRIYLGLCFQVRIMMYIQFLLFVYHDTDQTMVPEFEADSLSIALSCAIKAGVL